MKRASVAPALGAVLQVVNGDQIAQGGPAFPARPLPVHAVDVQQIGQRLEAQRLGVAVQVQQDQPAIAHQQGADLLQLLGAVLPRLLLQTLGGPLGEGQVFAQLAGLPAQGTAFGVDVLTALAEHAHHATPDGQVVALAGAGLVADMGQGANEVRGHGSVLQNVGIRPAPAGFGQGFGTGHGGAADRADRLAPSGDRPGIAAGCRCAFGSRHVLRRSVLWRHGGACRCWRRGWCGCRCGWRWQHVYGPLASLEGQHRSADLHPAGLPLGSRHRGVLQPVE